MIPEQHCGLTFAVQAKINSVFKSYPKIDKVILYGSRAMGNFKNGSDIDLVLVGNGLTLDLQLKIADELDNLLLPYKIDLSILAMINNPALKEHIANEGKLFFEKRQ